MKKPRQNQLLGRNGGNICICTYPHPYRWLDRASLLSRVQSNQQTVTKTRIHNETINKSINTKDVHQIKSLHIASMLHLSPVVHSYSSSYPETDLQERKHVYE